MILFGRLGVQRVTGGTAGAAVRRRRPRDRKQLILDAAAARFFALGYHQVGMADIAADVDIAPSALYRHFRGKQELLLATMNGYLTTLENQLAEPGDQDDLIGRLVDFALGNREFGLLWEREAGLLSVTEQRAIRHRLRAVARTLATAIASATGSPPAEAELRALAILSMLDSPAHQHAEPDRTRAAPLLRAAADAIARVPLPIAATPSPSPPTAPSPPTVRPMLTPASRREALLAVAIRLFAQRGFPSVGLTDIGAAAGIAGPSVYNHFASKVDLLVAALNRGTEVLWFGLHRALADATNSADALTAVVRGYAEFAIADSDIVSILIAEIINLPTELASGYRRTQREYIAEWIALLRGSRPELDLGEASVLVQGALALANSLARVHHLRARPGFPVEVAALAEAVLHVPLR